MREPEFVVQRLAAFTHPGHLDAGGTNRNF